MVFLQVSNNGYRIGRGDFLWSFFSTIANNLEEDYWGNKFPYILDKFCQGELKGEDISNAKEELLIIREKLKEFSPSNVIWDAEDLNKQPPWGNDISKDITDLSNYFVTCEGEDLFDVIFEAFNYAQETKQGVIIRNIDYNDPSVTYFDARG